MSFKQLCGYGLTILGICLAPLILLLGLDSQTINTLFLIALAICAISFVASGIFILNRNL